VAAHAPFGEVYVKARLELPDGRGEYEDPERASLWGHAAGPAPRVLTLDTNDSLCVHSAEGAVFSNTPGCTVGTLFTVLFYLRRSSTSNGARVRAPPGRGPRRRRRRRTRRAAAARKGAQ
jgi:hypothetical protein